MITNPSTLGLFEKRIGELLDAVHEAGALAYMDGANLNAILGRFKPGEAGFDVMHFNVHKTFSTPHGGGGPGAGPVGVGEKLLPYLPSPRVLREDDGTFRLERPDERPTSIGRLRSLRRQHRRPRARLRLPPGPRRLGPAPGQRRRGARGELPEEARRRGLRDPVRPGLQARVRRIARPGSRSKTGVRTLDIAKRLIDHGFHPPTIYFPLIVDEAMLIEPTETESVETLDAFADALIAIAAEAESDPDIVRRRPAHRAGRPPRRGDGRPPAEPPLAGDDRRRDALPRLKGVPAVNGCRARTPLGALRPPLRAPGASHPLACGARARLPSDARARRTQWQD